MGSTAQLNALTPKELGVCERGDIISEKSGENDNINMVEKTTAVEKALGCWTDQRAEEGAVALNGRTNTNLSPYLKKGRG